MNCYEIAAGKIIPGIPVEDGVVVLGEEGLGRKRDTVPLPDQATIEDGRLTRVGDGNAPFPLYLYISDHSGYRGEWLLQAFAERECMKGAGQPVLQDGERTWFTRCPHCGGRLWHGYAPADELTPDSIGRVIGEGWCAQGAAGKMGGGPEYLIRIEKPVRFSIRRLGRLYGESRRVNVIVAEDGSVTAVPAAEWIAQTKERGW